MINKFYNWLDKTEKNWTIEKAKKCYWIIGIVFVIFFTIIFIISIQTSSSKKSKGRELDYITKPDGTREWYYTDSAIKIEK